MSTILTLSAVSKRFGAIVIANGIDLAVSKGEALGILGPNGAGKTTLFGMITGTVMPDAGRVIFRDEDITHLPPDKRCRKGIARAFQVPQPFGGMTVFENLVVAAAFGRSKSEREVYGNSIGIIERCGLTAKINRPAGALTLLDRKRLELARALATEPQLLLLDEVAGGLTEQECLALVALIGDIRKSGQTIVWIEHVIHALTAVVDRVVVLHGGAFIAQGEPQSVIRSPQVAEIYMGIPVDV
jgi:branched-chain amino acid transport system ATP-binding protein